MFRFLILSCVLVQAASAAGAETVIKCRNVKPLRERAFCLLKTDAAPAIGELHNLAMEIYEKDSIRKTDGHLGIGGREDFFYAAENAGVIAAKTSEEELYRLVRDGEQWTKTFALRGLTHTLSILRMGYAKGPDADKKRRQDILGKVGATCLPHLDDKVDEVVTEAAACLGEAGDPKYAEKLIRAIVGPRSSRLRRTMLEGVEKLPGLSGEMSSLRPLLKVLEEPMPASWSSDDVWIRGDVCRLLTRYVNSGDSWAERPAQKAIDDIGDKNSQAKEYCQRLLNRT